jgi:hypothetical protein
MQTGAWQECAALAPNLIIDYTITTRQEADQVAGLTFESLSTTALYTACTLTLTASNNFVAPYLYLRVADDSTPSDWASTTNEAIVENVSYPSPDTAGTLGWGGAGIVLASSVQAAQVSAGDTITFSWTQSTAITDGANEMPRTFTNIYRGPNYAGKLAFTIDTSTDNAINFASTFHTTYDGPSLVVTESPLLTGLDNVQGNSRVDRCPICGFASLRETWIMCAYHKRLECPPCADPADVEEHRRPIKPEDRIGLNPEG